MIRCLKFSFPPSVSASCASTVKLPADLWLLSFVFFPLPLKQMLVGAELLPGAPPGSITPSYWTKTP